MKKAVLFSIMALAVQITVSGMTQSLSAEEVKIGAVNFQRALNEVEQGKKAKAALKSEFDAKQRKLTAQQNELKQLQEEAQKQGGVLSQEAMAAKQKTFQEKYLELQKSMATYRDDLVQKEAKMTGQILENLKKVVAEVAQKEGFDLVVETSQDAVLYAKAKEDLTSRLISLYNQRYTGSLKIE
jgi:outer membrane protein